MASSDDPDPATEPAAAVASAEVAEVFGAALRLGLTSFGGPIAHLGYFREEYVVRRRWLTDQAYSELIALCQFLPGPASSQVGFAIGWTRAGAFGALAAWLAFTAPSALLMLAFAAATRFWHGAVADAAVHGLKVAAVAVVAQAIVGMARSLTPDLPRIALAVMAAALMSVFAHPAMQVLLIAVGAVAGIALCKPEATSSQHAAGRTPPAVLGMAALVTFAVLLAVLPALSGSGPWFALADVFYRAGALVFGGGHVVLPLLREGLVPHWMNDAAFLAGYGAAQAVPGPLFTFAGYLGAVARPDMPVAAAALGIAAIFAPGLLLVTGSLAFRQRIMGSAIARRAISGVNAVVVGLLAAAFWNPVLSTGVTRLIDLFVAAAALLLLRFKAPPIVVVAMSVAANVVWDVA
jgi:chromate transporter